MQRRFLLRAACSLPAMTGATALRAQAEPPIAAALRERVRHEGVGLVAAVVNEGQSRFAAAGRRSPDSDAAPDADTLFEYGSITKTFTALLLAEAVVRGELQLDGTVESVLPNGQKLHDSAGAPITWADLATHRSGLPPLPGNMKSPQGADPYDYGRPEMLEFLGSWRPQYQRGAAFEYSNLGFGLLGEALGLRAGRSYDELLRQRVLQPLGLEDMRLNLRAAGVPGLAMGHDSQRRPVPNWRFDAMAGAGALVGSARSLARYAQAALGDFAHPLEGAFKLVMTQRYGPPQAIALGWLVGPLNGQRIFNHDGGTAGYSTSLFIDPARRRAALVLANASVGVNDLALHALEPNAPVRDIAAEAQQRARNAASIDASALAALAGVYALNTQFKLTVRVHEGKLMAQATGQGEFELFAVDARRYFARITPLEVQFDGDNGAPAALTLMQSGQRLRFMRE